MKTLLKVLIAAVILNATVRAAMAAWSYYQFKDAAQQTILFGGQSTPAELQESIVRRAGELGLPIGPEDVEVRRDGPRTVAEASYTQPVELFPRYTYPFEFTFTVDSFAVATGLSR
jgi:hypothetical protein